MHERISEIDAEIKKTEAARSKLNDDHLAAESVPAPSAKIHFCSPCPESNQMAPGRGRNL